MKRLFVPGVFDVFHVGHLNYLRNASQHGDHVIVGVQDDRAVKACKNIDPIVPLADRMSIIEALGFVDEVVSYTAVFQGPLLEGLEIDVFAAGDEYGQSDQYPDQKKTLAFCKEHGIEVVQIPRTERVSSTQIRGQLRSFWDNRAKLAEQLSSGVTVLGSFKGDQEKVAQETQVEVDKILEAIGDTRGKSLLDLGCGDGRHLMHLAPKFERLVGVDYAGGLLKLAEKRLAQAGGHAELVEADVSTYRVEETFDVLLLSGIIPCLDDDQMASMLQNLEAMAGPDTSLLVRSSIGTERRIDVVNQYSAELQSRYTAYYRKVDEIVAAFDRHGWSCQANTKLYQHRPDSAVWWFEFERAAAPVVKA